MAPKNESPADKVKRELEEKQKRDDEAAAAAAEQQTADKLTPEEEAALAAADAQDAKDKELAQLRDQLAKSNAELDGAKKHIATLNAEKAEEDPEIVAERQRRFARAEAFEKNQQERKQRLAQARRTSPTTYDPVDDDEEGGQPVDEDGMVSVRMPKAAYDVMYRLATSLPLSTPPEHVMCGYGGIKVTVGIIRGIAGVRMR